VTSGAIVSSAADTPRSPPTVFLSYASEDRQAARRIGDALPAYGLEVWYDESELGGGDVWDQKIRKQIRDCDYFMALISAQTEARHEGYFRREWRLAVERTLDMADDHTFLLPVVIDDTEQAGARVPEKFLAVQWLRVPGGEPTAALEGLCRRLVSGGTPAPLVSKKAVSRRTKPASSARTFSYPEVPREEPGQRMRFWFGVAGWALRSAWIFFRQLPRWIRILAYVWIGVALLSKGCSSGQHESTRLSKADAQKLKAIAEQYRGSSDKADVAKLGAQIAKAFSDEAADQTMARSPLLAIPFTAPAGDSAAEKLADSSFAQVYGRVSISHPKLVGLTKDPLSSRDLGAALERGRANHSTYILYGTVDKEGSPLALTVKIVRVENGAVVWSKSYPAEGADPANIAAEVDSKIPSLEDD
jgi:TolB-like protein